jgi:hypothetical protein
VEQLVGFVHDLALIMGVLVAGYLLTYVCSAAYFKCKLDYQNKFFRKFDPNHPVGDK